ncbi:MAG: glycosyltransferase, partial [Cyclobacteriaceae bacterium]
MEIFLLIIYILSLLFIFLFSLGQLHLTWHYRRRKRETPETLTDDSLLPDVTVQLPVFNEKYVAGRLIDCIAVLDYPSDKLEIQVLDDSTDETSQIIEERAAYWAGCGIDIRHIRRRERTGFKAGALQYGLEQ